MFKHLTILATITGLSAPLLAHAQIVPNIEPGRIQQRFEQREGPKVGGESLMESIKLPESGPQLAEGITFKLNQVKVVGATAFTDEAIKKLYASKLNKEVSLQDVQAIVQAITIHYRNAGYILSRAFLPPQRIGAGEVTIQVVEGRVDQIEFQGSGVANSTIQAYADKIKSSVPLHVDDLERYLLLIDDLAGMTARGTLKASSDTTGASDLIISLSQDHYEGRITVDNRGSRFLGPLQGDAQFSVNNRLNLGEQISIRTIQTLNLEEMSYFEGTYTQPIWHDGTRIRILASKTDTEPGDSLDPLDIEGDSTSFLVSASHPIIRSRAENLIASAGFTYRDSESATLGINTYEDNVRTINASLTYDFLDSWLGVSQLGVGITQGLNVLGANDSGDPLSRANADPEFTKFTFNASRLQSLSDLFAIQLTATGQYSKDELFASEEFAAGGASYGSAYDPSEISGDHGVAARAELQYNGTYNNDWLDNYQVYGFYDIARAWNINALAGEEKRSSLTSAGLGLRFGLFEQWRGSVEFAMPITRDVAAEGSDGDDNRVFFSLSYILP